MGRILVLANQTLGGAELDAALRERIERGEGRFFVVVPMIEPAHEADAWVPADPAFGIAYVPTVDEDAMEEARKRSQQRLERVVERVGALGGEAEGEVGGPDPFQAARDVLDREDFDEVLVSTLPSRISRWLKMDLPSRLERSTETTVTTVEASSDEE